MNDSFSSIADRIDQAEVLDAGEAFDGGVPPVSSLSRELATQPANDTGNGKRLLARYGDQLRFVREVGPHVWTGTHWDGMAGTEHALRLAQKTAALIGTEAASFTRMDGESDEDFDKRKARRHAWGVTSGNDGRIKAMIAQAAPHATFGPEDFDHDPMVLNVENGTLRFKVTETGKARVPEVSFGPHLREDLITRMVRAPYDPDADAPLWRAFIGRVQPDAKIARFLQVWTGYCLTGLTGEQKLVFFYGTGRNGKSTFVDILADMLSSYAASLRFESLAGENSRRGDQATPDLARLPGVRFLRAAEPEQGMRFKEAEIKAITGGEKMLVRHLHAKFFEMQPVFKLVLSGNHKPDIRGLDEGIWRRILLVPWDVKIPVLEVDTDLKKKLWQERSGILNWALDGLRLYLEEGLDIPAAVRAATDEYRADSDPIGDFIATCTEPDPHGHIEAGKFYQAYVYWAQQNGMPPWKGTAFGRALGQKGLAKEMGRIRKYTGIVLKSEAIAPEAPLRSRFDD